MSAHEPLSSLDNKINDRGFFERILVERDKFDAERDKRLDERFRAQETALAAALAERDKSLASALEAAEKAVIKAEVANEKRFESANEWRGQSADRERTQQEQLATFSATLLPRETYDSFLMTHNEAIRRLENFQSRILGALALTVVVVPTVSALIVWALSNALK